MRGPGEEVAVIDLEDMEEEDLDQELVVMDDEEVGVVVDGVVLVDEDIDPGLDEGTEVLYVLVLKSEDFVMEELCALVGEKVELELFVLKLEEVDSVLLELVGAEEFVKLGYEQTGARTGNAGGAGIVALGVLESSSVKEGSTGGGSTLECWLALLKGDEDGTGATAEELVGVDSTVGGPARPCSLCSTGRSDSRPCQCLRLFCRLSVLSML